MRLIKKDTPPNSLEIFKHDITASYSTLPREIKDNIKSSLLREQKGICAYCEVKLKDSSRVSIEHHCEQSICNGKNAYPDRTLDYTNMLAVCKGIDPRTQKLHCDKQKATKNSTNGLPMTLSPLIDAHIKTLSFSSTGLIKSSNATFNLELNNILNLNLPYLKDMRSRKWAIIFRNSYDKNMNLNRKKMKKMIDRELDISTYFLDNCPSVSSYIRERYT